MVFSPFAIPTAYEHQRDVQNGKTQVPYPDLVALLQAIDEAEEELLSAAAGAHMYMRPLEEGHPEHPRPEQIEPTTLRRLYQAMHEPILDWTPIEGRRGRAKERYPIKEWQQQLERWREITERICQRTLQHEERLAGPSQEAQAG